MEIANFLFFILLFIIFWEFLGYPALMAYYAKRNTKEDERGDYHPFVSVILPTYNEEKVIGRRIRNILEQEYPKEKYEIIIVDSGSRDNTRGIASSFIETDQIQNPRVMLISQSERKGKADAVNYAVSHASGEIIIVSDTNSVYNLHALSALVQPFRDQQTGGVTGRYSLASAEGHYESSESFYWYLEDLMLEGESVIDSVGTVIGTIMAWKKEKSTFDPDCLSEDLEMAIRTRRNGLMVRYVSSAVACESASSTRSDQLLQRRRTAAGTIQALLKHRAAFFPPKNLYFALILPSHKILPVLSPFIFISLVILFVFVHADAWFMLLTGIFLLAALSLGLYLKRCIGHKLSGQDRVRGIMNLGYYFLLNEYAVLLGWKDILSRSTSVKWTKAESTRI